MNRAIIGAAVAGLVALAIIFGSWYTIDQTERGVLLRTGAVIGTAQPGLGFKVPLHRHRREGERKDHHL